MASPEGLKLEAARSIFGASTPGEIQRLLKKAVDAAVKDTKFRWKAVGHGSAHRSLDRRARISHALTDALISALVIHANNSGPRPSIRKTAPDTGGRSFHFSYTTVKAGSSGSPAHAHAKYIERESAVERIAGEEAIDAALAREVGTEALGRDPAQIMQSYLEDERKIEVPEVAARAPGAEPFGFSFGNIGPTKEERSEFWALLKEHARDNARLQSRFILELPHEATPDQRREIVESFCHGLPEGLPYHAVLHAPTEQNDPRNFHAHVVCSTMPAEKRSFAYDGLDDGSKKPEKERWDFTCFVLKRQHKNVRRVPRWPLRIKDKVTKSTYIYEERSRFAAIVNRVMEKSGSTVRYDPRSYDAMGLQVEAMKSISRIIEDKSRKGNRIVLDYARTKRDIEAELERIANQRAIDYADVAKVRAAVRAGDRELRKLEKEVGSFKTRPIVKRGVDAVQVFVKRKALDYANAKALYVGRAIEHARAMASLGRVVEATKPEVVQKLRARLAQSLLAARAKGNQAEIARLVSETRVVPAIDHAALLHHVAKAEVKAASERHAVTHRSTLNGVALSLSAWREAALGAQPDLTPTARLTAIRTGGIAINVTPISQANEEPPKPNDHAMWAAYATVVDQVFKMPFQKYMWGVYKRYGEFILENADPDVPGRTAIDLTNKLVEAIKQHPVKADELIMSYQNGRQVQQPGAPIENKPTVGQTIQPNGPRTHHPRVKTHSPAASHGDVRSQVASEGADRQQDPNASTPATRPADRPGKDEDTLLAGFKPAAPVDEDDEEAEAKRKRRLKVQQKLRQRTRLDSKERDR